jgi:ribosomal protein L32
VIPATLDNATQGGVQRYKNNYKTLNFITTALVRNVYDRVLHLKTAHDVWLKLCNTYEGSSEIKSSYKDTYNRQYQTFSQKPGESLDDCFARFESIMSSLRSCGPLVYSDNEHAKQFLYALDDHVWGMKIPILEESADFGTLDTEILFCKLKSHELSRQGHPNYDASLTSKALITSGHVGDHDANPINIVSSTFEFVLSSLVTASNEQYESIPDGEIALLARKFWALCKLCKERRRSHRSCFECGDTTHIRLDSSNKYDYSKGDKKKKKFQKIMF